MSDESPAPHVLVRVVKKKRIIESDDISSPLPEPRKDQCTFKLPDSVSFSEAHSSADQKAAVCEILQEFCLFKPVYPGSRFVTERGNTIWRFTSECCPVCLQYRDTPTKHHNQWIACNEDRFPNTTMLQCLKTNKRYVIHHLPF